MHFFSAIKEVLANAGKNAVDQYVAEQEREREKEEEEKEKLKAMVSISCPKSQLILKFKNLS
jgi:hypothetical protein